MSRQYLWRGETLQRRRRDTPPQYTPAWAAARQRRAESRERAVAEQPRNDLGFIIKTGPNGAVLYDPGPIDRYLWLQAHKDAG